MLKNNLEDIKKFAENHTLSETAIEFDVSYNRMVEFCKQNGIKFRKCVRGTNMTRAELMEYCKGKTKEEIAESLGLSEKDVRYFAINNSCRFKSPRKPNGKKGDRNEMILYLSKKYTYTSIAQVFGITKQCVEQINKHYGGDR